MLEESGHGLRFLTTARGLRFRSLVLRAVPSQ